MDQDGNGTAGEVTDSYRATFNLVDVDLQIRNLHVDASVLPVGDPVQLSWEGVNATGLELKGKWTDAVYLSADNQWDISDLPLATIEHTGGLPQGESYTESVVVAIPGVLPSRTVSDYFIIVRADLYNEEKEAADEGNNIAVAGPFGVHIRPLETTGVPATGDLTAADREDYFSFTLEPGQSLDMRLNGLATSGTNEMYVAYNRIPSRQDYDYRATTNSPDGRLIVAANYYRSDYYTLVYAGSVSTDQPYELSATPIDLSLDAVTPKRAGDVADTILTISGVGFFAGTTIELVANDGTLFSPSDLIYESMTRVSATFPAASVPPGLYTLRATNPGGYTAEVTDAVEIVEGGLAILETNLIVPERVGYHLTSTIYVEYSNSGDIAMPAPLLVLTAEQNGREGALLTMDKNLARSGFWTSAVPEGTSHSIQFLASGDTPGLLQPGESFRVPVYYVGWQQPWDFTYPSIAFSLGVLEADSDLPADWASLEEEMRPETISAEAWQPLFANFVTEVGDTWGGYVTMLDENAGYLRRLGQRVIDINDLLAFEFQQAQGFSLTPTLTSSVDASTQAPGMDITFSRFFSNSLIQRYEMGPFGRGWSDNWQFSLAKKSDGTVVITGPGGSRRIFQPDVRDGSYITQPGDHGTLTSAGGGAFKLRELDGTTFGYRSNGMLDYVEDTNGNRITCGYTNGLLTSLTHSSGQSLTISYNEANLIATITDHDARTTTFTYDAAREHLVSVEAYDGRIWTYNQSVGNGASTENALTEIGYPTGVHEFFTYDAEGRLASNYLTAGEQQVSYDYGSTGVVTVTDATGGESKFYFDHRGLLVRAEDPLGRGVLMTFDYNYNLSRVTDPAGRYYAYAYDALGNLTASTDALGNTTRFTYTNSFNQLDVLTDANGNRTNYDYDSRGNLTSITYADGSVESWSYDEFGNADDWTNRRGHVVDYTVNADGKLTSRTYEDGSVVTFTYDERGNLTQSVDPHGTTVFTYDENDYLTRIDYPAERFLAYTYDEGGRRTSMVDQLGHRTDYHYDETGRLWYLTDESTSEIVRYHYDQVGRLERTDKGNGTYTTYEYDLAGQILHLVNLAPDGTVNSRFDYTYDSRGRRTSMATLDGTWTYQYDDIGQLTHGVFDSANPSIADQDLLYVYDALGNRIRTVINGVTTEYVTNGLNQYTNVGDTIYVYDADGNLIQETGPEGTTTYRYDDDNRLIGLSLPDGEWDYSYDAFGNRVAASIGDLGYEYVIDPAGVGDVVGEYNSQSNVSRHYVHGIGLVSQTSAENMLAFYDVDAQGSVIAVTAQGGEIANSYSYLPFGRQLFEASTIPNPFTFTGGWGGTTDGSGLVSLRARQLAPDAGRFLSLDPIFVTTSGPSYNYVKNRPTDHIDPSGLTTQRQETVSRDEVHKFADIGFALLQLFAGPKVDSKVDTALNLPSAASSVISDHDKTVSDYADDLKNPLKLVGLGIAITNLEMIVHELMIDMNYDTIDKLQSINDSFTNDNASRVDYSPITQAIPDEVTDNGVSRTTTSEDPNDKLAPNGFGDANFISREGLMPYTIRFENKAEASAPAKWIRITDTLDENLDLSTFELTEIALGHYQIDIPDGLNSYHAMLPLNLEGNDIVVEVDVELNRDTRELKASFLTLDPETGWLPKDPAIGLLYPNDTTGRGDGSVSYIVDPKAGLTTGTEISNEARIYFDFNDPIDTPLVMNTIDAGTPNSQVAALPAITNSPIFPVNWSGNDDVGGSGVSNYTIYVSTNGGAFEVWLDRTTLTEAEFVGEMNYTYSFYSVARDNVGHVEETPLEADTVITVLESNEPPVLDPIADKTVSEGSLLSVIATATDPDGDGLTFSLDMAPPDATIDPNSGLFTWTPQDGNATAIVTVRVTDDGSPIKSDTTTFTITVTNVAPTVALSGPARVDEGSTYALTLGPVSDPGEDTVTEYVIRWGDASPDTTISAADLAVAGNQVLHTYGDGDASPTILVDLVDEDGTHGTAGALSIIVDNVAPTVGLSGLARIDEGSLYTLTIGAVSDPGDDRVTDYIIRWGDGTPNTTILAADLAAAGNQVLHTYADGDSNPTILVDLVDEDGTHENAGALSIIVDNVAPTVAIVGPPRVDEGSLYTLTIETVNDPGDDTITDYIIHWGDGTSDTSISAADLVRISHHIGKC